jgi:hypothetical protein
VERRNLLRAAVVAASVGAIAFVLAATTGTASADPAAAPLCGSNEAAAGTALAGDYRNLRVHGIAYVANGATLTVRGSLILDPGSCLDAFSTGTVHVGGNVIVGARATLALGCAPGSNGPPPIAPCYFTTTADTVGGDIFALTPKTMYLTAVTVGRNVVSLGGGFSTPGLNFPIKDMDIGGNLIVVGWHGGPGAWFGALRNHVGRNMVISGNVGYRPGPDGVPPNDSTEVLGNIVGGNLICFHNTPPAQYGDAYGEPGNGPNAVGHRAIGECADLTVPPASG